MSGENTITIPADLWAQWTTRELRDYATSLDREHHGGAVVFRRLADEIERQAPRPEGWYHVKHEDERILWWSPDDGEWSYNSRGDDYASVHQHATITPVTIGRAD